MLEEWKHNGGVFDKPEEIDEMRIRNVVANIVISILYVNNRQLINEFPHCSALHTEPNKQIFVKSFCPVAVETLPSVYIMQAIFF